MKKHISEFFKRGFIACGFGPLVLAVIYLILKSRTSLEILTVTEVCTGIFSLSVLAFVAGGMNVVYQIERLPLATAVFIHGIVLYAAYLATYLINGWLKDGMTPLLVFTAVFVVGYLVIWAIIYTITRKKTKKINEILKKNQENPGEISV